MSETEESIQIQCPDCKTKFNLKAQALQSVSNPKFHCSKCDHIFEINNITDEMQDDFQDTEFEDLPSNSEIETENFNKTVNPFEQSSDYETNDNSDEKFLNSFPEATTEQDVEVKDEKFSQQIDNNDLEKDMQHYQSEQLELDDYYKKRAAQMQKKREEKEINIQHHLSNEVTFFQSLKFIAPLALVLIILFGFSFFLTNNPKSAKKTMSKFIGQTAGIAPSKLMISNVKASSYILDSGEKTLVIQGIIINGTDTDFSEVVLEAAAFDLNGKKLKAQKAYLNSSLGKTRITALNPRMIKTLQSRKPIKRVELKPGEKTKFVIALLDDQFDADIFKRTKHYVARIYSVI